MLCRRCEGQDSETRTPRRSARRLRVPTCDRCGTTILTLDGIALGDGDETFALLARFGLADTADLLLEPMREGT